MYADTARDSSTSRLGSTQDQPGDIVDSKTADDIEKSKDAVVVTTDVVPVDCPATDVCDATDVSDALGSVNTKTDVGAKANGKEGEEAVGYTELKRIYRRAAWYSLALTLVVAVLGASSSSPLFPSLPSP